MQETEERHIKRIAGIKSWSGTLLQFLFFYFVFVFGGKETLKNFKVLVIDCTFLLRNISGC